MSVIYGLVRSQVCTANDILREAQALGYADLQAFASSSTPEHRSAVYAKLKLPD